MDIWILPGSLEKHRNPLIMHCSELKRKWQGLCRYRSYPAKYVLQNSATLCGCGAIFAFVVSYKGNHCTKHSNKGKQIRPCYHKHQPPFLLGGWHSTSSAPWVSILLPMYSISYIVKNRGILNLI